MNDWLGKRILVIGAARQGQAAARYLASQGAIITLNDSKPVDDIRLHGEILNSPQVKKVFGSHPLALLEKIDMICVSGGVPLTLPLVAAGIQRGIPLTNDSQIFLQSVKATSIGITGSAGKTTTTTLVGAVAKLNQIQNRKSWVGGNIGNPLIESLNEIKPDDVVVLELSSFQLELMNVSPNIACILNITPNHLDRHGNMEAYTAAKARILENQGENDHAVLNREDKSFRMLKSLVKANLWTFGFTPVQEDKSVYCQADTIFSNMNGIKQKVMPISDLKLIGKHNLANALAATAISLAAGFKIETIKDGISQVHGIPHRLEFVRRVGGISWINDSIATAPERTMAALQSIPGPLVLLLGGRDKNLPWDNLAKTIHSRNLKVIVFGEAAALIENNLRKFDTYSSTLLIWKALKFEDALNIAKKIAKPRDSVLLSPGCTSYDEFKDFEERGNLYRDWVNKL